jgi:nitrite reductase/ring-hydroxylating ferredoxin subunit
VTFVQENWIDACSTEDVPEGGMHHCEHNGKWIVIYHVDGEFFATDNICPHAFALLSDGWLEDGLIECPLHGALFDIRTGDVKRGPAECAVKTYKVKISDNRVLCAI